MATPQTTQQAAAAKLADKIIAQKLYKTCAVWATCSGNGAMKYLDAVSNSYVDALNQIPYEREKFIQCILAVKSDYGYGDIAQNALARFCDIYADLSAVPQYDFGCNIKLA